MRKRACLLGGLGGMPPRQILNLDSLRLLLTQSQKLETMKQWFEPLLEAGDHETVVQASPCLSHCHFLFPYLFLFISFFLTDFEV